MTNDFDPLGDILGDTKVTVTEVTKVLCPAKIRSQAEWDVRFWEVWERIHRESAEEAERERIAALPLTQRRRLYGKQAAARRRMRIRTNGGVHTFREILNLLDDQKGLCAACGADIKKCGYHADHIFPLCLGGKNAITNIQLLCERCNRLKGRLHPDEWTRSVYAARQETA